MCEGVLPARGSGKGVGSGRDGDEGGKIGEITTQHLETGTNKVALGYQHKHRAQTFPMATEERSVHRNKNKKPLL